MSDDEQQLPCVNLKALNSSYTIDVKMLPCKTSSISPDKVYKTTELDQLYPEPKETTDGKEVLYLRGRKLIGESIVLENQTAYLCYKSGSDETINVELKVDSLGNFEREGNTSRLTNEKENLLEYVELTNNIMS
ncbi:hypothetical protein ACO0OE_001675 [Hanseniaspora uvarum]